MINLFETFFESVRGRKIRRREWEKSEYFIPEEVIFYVGGGIIISCTDQNGQSATLVLATDKDVWDWEFFEESIKSCTCGARHTSRPDYHLDFCDLYKKEK